MGNLRKNGGQGEQAGLKESTAKELQRKQGRLGKLLEHET